MNTKAEYWQDCERCGGSGEHWYYPGDDTSNVEDCIDCYGAGGLWIKVQVIEIETTTGEQQ